MSNDVWRWADPDGQQRRVRLDVGFPGRARRGMASGTHRAQHAGVETRLARLAIRARSPRAHLGVDGQRQRRRPEHPAAAARAPRRAAGTTRRNRSRSRPRRRASRRPGPSPSRHLRQGDMCPSAVAAWRPRHHRRASISWWSVCRRRRTCLSSHSATPPAMPPPPLAVEARVAGKLAAGREHLDDDRHAGCTRERGALRCLIAAPNDGKDRAARLRVAASTLGPRLPICSAQPQFPAAVEPPIRSRRRRRHSARDVQRRFFSTIRRLCRQDRSSFSSAT